MAKGYWIAHGDIHDPEVYERYKAANAVPFARHGARFLVRGGARELKEGGARARTVVIEFPTYAAALACWEDPDYVAAREIRLPVSESDLVIVEGWDG